MTRAWGAVGLAVAMAATGCGRHPGTAPARLLPAAQRIEVQEDWIEARHRVVLQSMRRHGIDMWILVTEEFHPDPLARVVVSPRPLVGNRDVFVFADTGGAEPEAVAVTRFAEENVQRLFVSPEEPRPAAEVLPELVAKFHPATIAVAVGGRRGPTRSITHDSYVWLVETLGQDAASRIVPADALVEDVLDTRLPEERPYYATLMELTDELARRALSSEVIEPGVTTVGEVRDWLFDRVGDLGLEPWFQPDLRVQRRGVEGATSRGFLAVAREATVIEAGDLVHLDFGMVYMGLASDWQRMAYVLRPGETDAPAGIRRALANTNLAQETLASTARPGMDPGEVYRRTMDVLTEHGITAQVYSHAIGIHGHGVGPTVDFRSADRADMRSSAALRPGSYLAVELNTSLAVPEWDGQEVFAMEEDTAWLSGEGYVFFRPRQTSLYLVAPR